MGIERSKATWERVDSECIEHDGYWIELAQLRRQLPFWTSHIAAKSWATPEIIAGLVAWAVGDR